MTTKDPQPLKSRVSRRQFLKLSGGAGAVLGAASTAAVDAAPLRPGAVPKWDEEVDVVVCGTGAAGFTAAVCAAARGQRVLMLEKAQVIGGTTAKSGGVFWVPNNSLMRRDGRADPKTDAMAYMARCASPQLYDPSLPKFGLRPADYALLEAYYDNASLVEAELAKLGALRASYFADVDGHPLPDYYAYLPENKAPIGRGLSPADEKGAQVMTGAEFIRQMSEAAQRLKVKILLDHRAEQLVVNDVGRVIGVQARHDGRTLSFGAKRGVIFGTGGFTHNAAMADNFLRGPIFGGCAVPSNTGDFVVMASGVGAALGNMNHAWWAEVAIEHALSFASVPTDVFLLGGDSMLVVNRYGRRVYNEKMLYNERTQAHFVWDAGHAEYPNLLTFLIYDERTAQKPGDEFVYPIPTPGFEAPYVIKAQTLAQLSSAIETRLKSLAGKAAVAARVSSAFRLAPDFAASLAATVKRFNEFAEHGVDQDFQRGATQTEERFVTGLPPSDKPNKALYPLSAQGPYYCVILGAGTLDTKGGPVVNARAEVLDAAGRVIAGLYGAGNCIASPARQGYFGGGATIGTAMTFAYLAAVNASKSV